MTLVDRNFLVIRVAVHPVQLQTWLSADTQEHVQWHGAQSLLMCELKRLYMSRVRAAQSSSSVLKWKFTAFACRSQQLQH